MRTPERVLKDEVRKYLKSIGAYFFMPVETWYGATTLDFLVCYRGRFVGIETKAAGRFATPRQQKVMLEIEKAGGTAFVAYSVEDVRRCL